MNRHFTIFQKHRRKPEEGPVDLRRDIGRDLVRGQRTRGVDDRTDSRRIAVSVELETANKCSIRDAEDLAVADWLSLTNLTQTYALRRVQRLDASHAQMHVSVAAVAGT